MLLSDEKLVSRTARHRQCDARLFWIDRIVSRLYKQYDREQSCCSEFGVNPAYRRFVERPLNVESEVSADEKLNTHSSPD